MVLLLNPWSLRRLRTRLRSARPCGGCTPHTPSGGCPVRPSHPGSRAGRARPDTAAPTRGVSNAVILLGFWPYFLFDHWPHTAAVSLDRTALLRSELCGCFPAHACGSRRDVLLSRPIHFTKGWRQLQAPTRRDNSDGAIEVPENGVTKRAR